jgi:hypothetical protein
MEQLKRDLEKSITHTNIRPPTEPPKLIDKNSKK